MTVFTSLKKKAPADKKLKFIDTRFSLQDPAAGERAYRQSHVEEAVYWDLEKDLSDMQKKGGRHPLPSRESLTELFRKSGLQLDDEIVIYDNGGEPFAARAWWILKFGGFRHVSISLEGFEELRNLGYRLDTKVALPGRSEVEPVWNDNILASKQEVKQMIDKKENGILVDARAAERYRGEYEPLDTIAGHIPSARNFDWSQLTKDQRFDTAGEGVQQLETLVSDKGPITVYCGSGVTAAPLYAMLKEKGYPDVRLYAGSYSDWIEDGDLPVKKSSDFEEDLS